MIRAAGAQADVRRSRYNRGIVTAAASVAKKTSTSTQGDVHNVLLFSDDEFVPRRLLARLGCIGHWSVRGLPKPLATRAPANRVKSTFARAARRVGVEEIARPTR